jgi:hypothetical protein
MYMYRAIYMLVFDSSLRKHEFVCQIVLRKFVVNKAAPGHYALRVLQFPPVGVIPPNLQTHFVLILLLLGEWAKPVKRFTKQCFLEYRGGFFRKDFCILTL